MLDFLLPRVPDHLRKSLRYAPLYQIAQRLYERADAEEWGLFIELLYATVRLNEGTGIADALTYNRAILASADDARKKGNQAVYSTDIALDIEFGIPALIKGLAKIPGWSHIRARFYLRKKYAYFIRSDLTEKEKWDFQRCTPPKWLEMINK